MSSPGILWRECFQAHGAPKTLWEKARVGCFKRTASKHVYYLGWNRSPAQVRCMRQLLRPGALGRPRGIGWRGRWVGGSGWGIHVNPWLIQVNVWQKPLQYCKVISFQLIKINEKKIKVTTEIRKNKIKFANFKDLPRLAHYRKVRGTRDQIANTCCIIEKAREFQKSIYFCFIDYAKAFDCVDHNKLWKSLKKIGIPDHLTCLMRNLYAGQEATIRTGHEEIDWFQIGKGVHQGCILSPCLFNLYAEYIMRNAGLDKAQAGIKIAGENINNLRYADNTTLMAESEEPKNLLTKVKRRVKKLA